MNLGIGQNVEIQTKMRSMYLGEDYKFVTFKGKVVPNPKWLDTDYVSVHTGEPNYPISYIHKRLIIGYEFSKERTDERIFEVKSKSKGKAYTVVSSKGIVSCNCTGYQFRRKCSHSDKVKDIIQKDISNA